MTEKYDNPGAHLDDILKEDQFMRAQLTINDAFHEANKEGCAEQYDDVTSRVWVDVPLQHSALLHSIEPDMRRVDVLQLTNYLDANGVVKQHRLQYFGTSEEGQPLQIVFALLPESQRVERVFGEVAEVAEEVEKLKQAVLLTGLDIMLEKSNLQLTDNLGAEDKLRQIQMVHLQNAHIESARQLEGPVPNKYSEFMLDAEGNAWAHLFLYDAMEKDFVVITHPLDSEHASTSVQMHTIPSTESTTGQHITYSFKGTERYADFPDGYTFPQLLNKLWRSRPHSFPDWHRFEKQLFSPME